MTDVVAYADAEVMQHEAETGRWLSLSGGAPAIVRVMQNARSQQFRITAHLENQCVLDTRLYFKMHYKCATPTFHQWRDEQKHVYGLNFPLVDQARPFEDIVRQALELIMRSREDYGPVMHANGGSHVEQAVYQEPHAVAGGGLHHGMHSAPVMRDDGAGYNRGASLAATQLAQQQQQRRQSQGSSHSGGGGGGGIYAQVQQPNGHHHQQQQHYATAPQQQQTQPVVASPPRPAVSSIPPAPPPPPPLAAAAAAAAAAPPAPPPPPPPPAMNGAALPPISSSAPPPPPPPPPPMAGGGASFLDEIKAGKSLRKVGAGGANGVENGSGGAAAAAAVATPPAAPKKGGGDLMSELMQTMSRRKNTRAQLDAIDNKSNISNGSSDSGNGISAPSSGHESNGGSSNGSTNGLAAGNGGGGASSSNGTVKRWPDPIKQGGGEGGLGHRKVPSTSSINSEDTLRAVAAAPLHNGLAAAAAGGGLSSDQIDRLKNEIMSEVRTELDKVKREILAAIAANR